MKKKKYNVPVMRVTHINLKKSMLLSSGMEVEISHGAKESSIFEEYEEDEME